MNRDEQSNHSKWGEFLEVIPPSICIIKASIVRFPAIGGFPESSASPVSHSISKRRRRRWQRWPTEGVLLSEGGRLLGESIIWQLYLSLRTMSSEVGSRKKLMTVEGGKGDGRKDKGRKEWRNYGNKEGKNEKMKEGRKECKYRKERRKERM